MVSSLVIVMFLAIPKVALISSGELAQFSRVIPAYSLTNFPPVKIAISWSCAFLLSPKDGALTAQILRLFLILFKIKPASNSL
jgi:hypothetical protein